MSHQWADCESTFIAARYDRIAGMIGFIDWLFFVPRHFRAHAAKRLALRPGQRVLEIGCGWGGFAIQAASEYGCRVTALAWT